MGHRRVRSLVVACAAALAACGGSGGSDDRGAGGGADTTAAAVDDDDGSITDAGGTTAGGSASTAPPGSSDDPGSPSSTAVASTAPASTAVPTTTGAPRPDVGDAKLIEAAVDLRPLEEVDFSPLADPTPVAVGDVLRTDSSGYAEIAYFDGSRTRLDVDTEFEVLELVDDAGRSTARTRMGLGRTWHRVESLGEGEGGFSVETSVATATVRGTAFAISCPTERACTFTVVEGSIEIELPDGTVIRLDAPSSLEVTDEGAGEPVTVPYEAVFGDDWLLDNGERDRDAGFAGPVAIYRAHGPGMASLSGTYLANSTVTGNECPGCVLREPTPLGPSGASGGVTITVDCSAGFPCSGDREGVPLIYDGAAVSYTRPVEDLYCVWDDDGDGEFDDRQTGRITTEVRIRLRPTKAAVRDGVWSVVELRGRSRVVYTVVDTGGCPDLFVGETEVVVSDVVWNR